MEMKCLPCALAHVRAFGTYTWEEIVVKMSTNTEFASWFKMAKELLAEKAHLESTTKSSSFQPESVEDIGRFSVTCWKEYLFVSDAEFKSKYGLSVTEAGYKPEVITSERGECLSGVLIETADSPHRKVSLMHSQETSLSRSLHSSAAQVRPKQGSDLATAYNTQVLKSLPGGFTKPLSFACIAEQVARKKEEKENPPPKPAPQVLVVEEPPKPEPELEEKEEEAEALMHAGASSFLALSGSRLPGSAQAKGKSRGRPRTQKEEKPEKGPSSDAAKRQRRGSAQATHSSLRAESVSAAAASKVKEMPAPASVAGSSHRSRSPRGSSKTTAKSPSEKLLGSIAKYTQCLSFSRVLAEDLHQDMHQARRILDAVATKEALAAEWVSFQTFVNERELALTLSADALHKLPRAERQEKLAEFEKILGDEAPPQTWCVAVLGCYLRDLLEDLGQKKDEPTITALVDAMLPFSGEGVVGVEARQTARDKEHSETSHSAVSQCEII